MLTERIFVSLGSNLGNREAYLAAAARFLADRGIEFLKFSSVFETEPLGFRNQSDFLNICCEITSSLPPERLLRLFLEAETAIGRVRSRRNGPREIDIDLLFYGSTVVFDDELVLPHPRLRERAFVLRPLAEIAGDFVDPVSGLRIAQLLKDCPDRSRVVKLGPLPQVSQGALALEPDNS